MFWESPSEMWHNKESSGNHRVKCGTTNNVLEITARNVAQQRMFWKSPRKMWHNKECSGNRRVKCGTKRNAL
jgi:hypothetical protein